MGALQSKEFSNIKMIKKTRPVRTITVRAFAIRPHILKGWGLRTKNNFRNKRKLPN
jgi:hypothetical protein